jgi:hypothetical protein
MADQNPTTSPPTAAETEYMRGFIEGWRAAWTAAWFALMAAPMSNNQPAQNPTTAGSTGYNDPVRCPYCGIFHTAKCPLVKAYEYHPDGTVKRVEFFAPADCYPIHIAPSNQIPVPAWALGGKYV